MFIAYDIRNGVEYAKLCVSKRKGKQVTKSYIYLGKVIDKGRCIFQNKERGVFMYNLYSDSYVSLGKYEKSNANIHDDNTLVCTNTPTQSSLNTKDGNIFCTNTSIQPIGGGNATNTRSSSTNTETFSSNTTADVNTSDNSATPQSHITLECTSEPYNVDIMSYGEVNFINTILRDNHFDEFIRTISKNDGNVLYLNVLCYLINGSCSAIKYWYNHSIVKKMFPIPNNDLSIGYNDVNGRTFYESYLKFIEDRYKAPYTDLKITSIDDSNDSVMLSDAYSDVPLYAGNVERVKDILQNFDNVRSIFVRNIDMLDVVHPLNVNGNEITTISPVPPYTNLYNDIIDKCDLRMARLIEHKKRYFHVCNMTINYRNTLFHAYAYCDILKKAEKDIYTLQQVTEMDINRLNRMLSRQFDRIVISSNELNTSSVLGQCLSGCKHGTNNMCSDNIFFLLCSLAKYMTCDCLKHMNISFEHAMTMLSTSKCYYVGSTLHLTPCDNELKKLCGCAGIKLC